MNKRSYIFYLFADNAIIGHYVADIVTNTSLYVCLDNSSLQRKQRI